MQQLERNENYEDSNPSSTSKGRSKKRALEENERERDIEIEKAKRTEIRKGYRSLIQKTEENQHELSLPPDPNGDGKDKLMDVLNEANKLFQDVKETREAKLDSELLVLTSKLALSKSLNIKMNFNNNNPNDFVDKCLSLMDKETHLDWEALGEITKDYIKIVPSVKFMYGTLNIVPKEKKKIVRRQKEKIEEKQKINDNVEHEEEGEGLETLRQVNRVFEYLKKSEDEYKKKKKDLPFFEFILDPSSYTHTIENLFHLSFLVRDGIASLSESNKSNNEIVLEKREPPNPEDYKNGIKRAQAVLKFDYESWERMKNNFTNLTTPLIPSNEEILSQQKKSSSQKSSTQKSSTQKSSTQKSSKSTSKGKRNK